MNKNAKKHIIDNFERDVNLKNVANPISRILDAFMYVENTNALFY